MFQRGKQPVMVHCRSQRRESHTNNSLREYVLNNDGTGRGEIDEIMQWMRYGTSSGFINRKMIQMCVSLHATCRYLASFAAG